MGRRAAIRETARKIFVKIISRINFIQN